MWDTLIEKIKLFNLKKIIYLQATLILIFFYNQLHFVLVEKGKLINFGCS